MVRGHLRFDHVIVGGVEDIAADDPHDALLHDSLVGSPGQPRLRVLLTGPERRVGGNRDGAVGTWGGRERGSQRVRVLQEARNTGSRALRFVKREPRRPENGRTVS